MKLRKYKQQQGFSILAVILVIVAIVVAIGVWALSGQSNTSTSSNGTLDIQASSLINDSAAIKTTFDTLIINGADYKRIVFLPNTASTATQINILDPLTGMSLPSVNNGAIRVGATSPEGIWVYNADNFRGWNIGSVSGKDPMIMVAGIKDSVCKRINQTLHGTQNIPAPFNADTSASKVVPATTANPNSTTGMDFFAATGLDGWSVGCFTTHTGQPDNNIFFRVLKAV